MKKYLRSFLITSASLFISSRFIETVTFAESEKTIFLAGLAITLVNLFIKPVLNLLLLPVNLLTLGLFRWLVNVFAFYLVILIVPGFKIDAFLFPGFEHSGFVFPSVQLSFFWTLVLVSFIISFVSSLLYWVFKK